MLINPIDFDMEALDAHSTFFSDQVRGDGAHLGSILRDLANRVIHKGKRVAVEDMGKEELARMSTYTEVGFIWERILTDGFRGRMLQRRAKDLAPEPSAFTFGQEFTSDSIFMNPDASEVSMEGEVVEEYKATWRSMRKMSEFSYHFFEWDHQIRGYCRVKGVTKARLFVLWVNGDYKPPVPRAVLYNLEYTQEELDESWAMVCQHRDFMAGQKEL